MSSFMPSMLYIGVTFCTDLLPGGIFNLLKTSKHPSLQPLALKNEIL